MHFLCVAAASVSLKCAHVVGKRGSCRRVRANRTMPPPYGRAQLSEREIRHQSRHAVALSHWTGSRMRLIVHP
eukprot:2882567-Prymnesium_polylepis.1